jgi:hypothetical protein
MPMNKFKPNTSKPKYEPTSQGRTAIARIRAQKSARPTPPLKVTAKEGAMVSSDHSDEVIGSAPSIEATGTVDGDFFAGLFAFPIDKNRCLFTVSLLTGMKPSDQIEAMLIAQMAAVHRAHMRFAQQFDEAETILERDIAERGLNKSARTFAAQMEALNRYRSDGQQKMTAQHVSVSGGSQAIVGNVTQAPRDAAPNEAVASPRHSRTGKPANDDLDEPARTPVAPTRGANK